MTLAFLLVYTAGGLVFARKVLIPLLQRAVPRAEEREALVDLLVYAVAEVMALVPIWPVVWVVYLLVMRRRRRDVERS